MRSAAMIGAIALCFPFALAPVDAQGLKTTVTGPAPFALGMSEDDALRVDPALQPAGALVSSCPARIHTVGYSAQVTAPVGGESYSATLTLCFYQGRLGLILVQWITLELTRALQGGPGVISIARALAAQLTSSYASELIKQNSSSKVAVHVELADAQGNALDMTAGTANPSGISDMIRLAYWWGPFARAVRNAPSVPTRLSSY